VARRPKREITDPYLFGGATKATAITTEPPSRYYFRDRTPGFLTKFLALVPGSQIILLNLQGHPYTTPRFMEVETVPGCDFVTGLLFVQCVAEVPDVGWCRLMVQATHRGLREGDMFSYQWSIYLD